MMAALIPVAIQLALRPTRENLITIKQLLQNHYFNFKLDEALLFRDYTAFAINEIRVATGAQQNTRKEYSSVLCATRGVMEVVEEDIDLIEALSPAEPRILYEKGIVPTLKARSEKLLQIMREEAMIKTEVLWDPVDLGTIYMDDISVQSQPLAAMNPVKDGTQNDIGQLKTTKPAAESSLVIISDVEQSASLDTTYQVENRNVERGHGRFGCDVKGRGGCQKNSTNSPEQEVMDLKPRSSSCAGKSAVKGLPSLPDPSGQIDQLESTLQTNPTKTSRSPITKSSRDHTQSIRVEESIINKRCAEIQGGASQLGNSQSQHLPIPLPRISNHSNELPSGTPDIQLSVNASVVATLSNSMIHKLPQKPPASVCMSPYLRHSHPIGHRIGQNSSFGLPIADILRNLSPNRQNSPATSSRHPSSRTETEPEVATKPARTSPVLERCLARKRIWDIFNADLTELKDQCQNERIILPVKGRYLKTLLEQQHTTGKDRNAEANGCKTKYESTSAKLHEGNQANFQRLNSSSGDRFGIGPSRLAENGAEVMDIELESFNHGYTNAASKEQPKAPVATNKADVSIEEDDPADHVDMDSRDKTPATGAGHKRQRTTFQKQSATTSTSTRQPTTTSSKYQLKAPKIAPSSSSDIMVKWEPTTKKSDFLPRYCDEPFMIFFCEPENPKYSADDSHQVRHVYLPEVLVRQYCSSLAGIFAKKRYLSGGFDAQDNICWDPTVSKSSKQYKDRSLYVLEFIKHLAESGDNDAAALLQTPSKIWGAFLHWWRYAKDGFIAAISCPWEKERALKIAGVLGADEGYVDAVKGCLVREKKYEKEEDDLMWRNHTHPDWLYLYDRGRYNMLKAKGRI